MESGVVSTKFIDALLAAAKRGVQVYVLLDGFGSSKLNSSDRHRLNATNVFLQFYNPLQYGSFRRNFFRDHRKILVIDDTIAYIGGMGLSDFFIDIEGKHSGWRETLFAIKGECVLDWHHAYARVDVSYAKQLPLAFNENSELLQTVLPSRVNCSIAGGQKGIKRSLIKRIRTAERQCWIATAYFLPSFKVRRALVRAARRGVDVRLLLPGNKTDHPAIRHAGRRFYYRLLKAGVKIYEYQPKFSHQKVLLCDSWVSIGSSNIDRWNFRWNLEANQEVEEQGVVNQVVEMFETDFSHSSQCAWHEWQRRSFYSRMLENFWGTVDRLLDRHIR